MTKTVGIWMMMNPTFCSWVIMCWVMFWVMLCWAMCLVTSLQCDVLNHDWLDHDILNDSILDHDIWFVINIVKCSVMTLVSSSSLRELPCDICFKEVLMSLCRSGFSYVPLNVRREHWNQNTVLQITGVCLLPSQICTFH